MSIIDHTDYLRDTIHRLATMALRLDAPNKAKSLLEPNINTTDIEYQIRAVGYQLRDTMAEAKRLDRMEQEQRENELAND